MTWRPTTATTPSSSFRVSTASWRLDLGFSLREITELLEQVSAGDLRAMLERKQVEVTHKLQEEQTRLARLRARLELPDDDTFTVRRRQGAKTAASLMFSGYDNELDRAARTLLLWAGANGYGGSGAAREVHLSGPRVETGKDKPVVVELLVPVVPHGDLNLAGAN